MNPSLSISAWIWSSTYDETITVPATFDLPARTYNIFGSFHLGRYVWAYIFCPLIAAVPAGLLAGIHLRNI